MYKNIIKVYTDFKTKDYYLDNKEIESIVLNNDDFKYFRVVVDTPLFNDKGEPLTDKKGKLLPDTEKRDTENIPANISFDNYMAENVLPYNKYAYIEKENKNRL